MFSTEGDFQDIIYKSGKNLVRLVSTLCLTSGHEREV